jgi:hypothetical protein
LTGNLEIRKLVIFIFHEYLCPKVRCTYIFFEKVIGISDLPVLPSKCNQDMRGFSDKAADEKMRCNTQQPNQGDSGGGGGEIQL